MFTRPFHTSYRPPLNAEFRGGLGCADMGKGARRIDDGPPPLLSMAAISCSDIAREVGLAKSNIYCYFESREHIYLVVLQRLASQFEQRLYLSLESGPWRRPWPRKSRDKPFSRDRDSPEQGLCV